MQIRNDFSNFSGREYHNSHTHHITKCLHEEEHKKHDGGNFDIRKETVQQDKGTEQKTQQDVFFEHNVGTDRQKTPMKKGLGMLKEIWDSMGQEEPERIKDAPAAGQKGLLHSHIAEAASLFQAAVSDRIAGKWRSVKEKIRVHIKSALKHFGRNRDFGTLSDPKGRSTKNREGQEPYNQKQGKGTRRKTPDLRTAVMSDTHLMDSYSKTGEYCRLNENLTYRKNKMAEQSEKLDKPL